MPESLVELKPGALSANRAGGRGGGGMAIETNSETIGSKTLRNPKAKPSIFSPKPSSLNPKPSTLNAKL